ncbi:MAG: cytochrome c biogenesis protein/redoxin [Clostridium sp.]
MDILKLIFVFLEGVISFVSPCVLPILPVYLSILSSSSVDSLRNPEKRFFNTDLFKNTILFTLGISTTFFILGSSISVLSKFFITNKDIVMFFGGILIILMGIFYMGILKLPFLQREKRFNMEVKSMSPIAAYMLGFTFSFGWTPCIGPMLASVLIMASGSQSIFLGNILILFYSLGFIVPFILISVFYSKLFKTIDKIKTHMGTIKKVGGIILIITGLIMTLQGMDKTIEYFRESPPRVEESKDQIKQDDTTSKEEVHPSDFTLKDQYGNVHTLSDYKGKVVFLNFWATWCPPCKKEMPDIEKIYKEYGKNSGDVIILGVAAPNMGDEGDEESIKEFLNDAGYTFPVVFDNGGSVMGEYYINAFPTTFIINKSGSVNKYVPGAINEDTMKMIIQEAILGETKK